MRREAILTLNDFEMGWKGSEPNKSWFPLMRRGAAVFGGGATEKGEKISEVPINKSIFHSHRGGGDT